MSDWTPTERVREAAFNTWQDTSASLPIRDRLDAVLTAVGPSIAAQALRDADDEWTGRGGALVPRTDVVRWLRARADQIEKGDDRG